MSDGTRTNAKKALELAQIIKGALADACDEIIIAGSLRRGKADVGDVEIVALPKHAPSLLARLDKMVIEQMIRKAYYGEDRTTRWGDKYRGFEYQHMRFEVFLGDVDNIGYIKWLRTGPGDANQWVMSQCIAQRSPYRAVGGYWTVSETGKRISVPTEVEMFRLLGMSYVEPQARTLNMYMRQMNNVRWAREVNYIADAPGMATQTSMF